MSDGSNLSLERRRFELLDRVVELPPEEREAVLAESDPGLAGDVRAMLAADEQGTDEFLAPVSASSEPLADLSRAIGPYRLIELLGEGGMGQVFLAEQSEPVKRRVALKILRFGAATREARARFEAERHAMGRLDHPNVGKILEAGTTPNGLPYFAMELIDGEPVTAYCDRRSLSLEDRLRLFVDVCRGADHAHRKLLLHRDLKPSNVLVTEVDGRAVAKIIDFGIAKGLDSSLADATLATGGNLIGTPAYMSPEALDRAGDVDTRSDVFSLGVVLYELMTGNRPWPEDDDSPLSALKRQAESETMRPSTRVTGLDPDSKTAIARRRGEEPAELARRLRGDLDWIALKAVAHEPSERYGSAADLADDVERFLADEPVNAHAPTAGYLLLKLVRRHRGRVLAAAMVAAALVLGAVGTAVGLVRARAEAERAHAALDRALESQQTSSQLSSYLVGLFEAADSEVENPSEVSARELLERSSRTLDEQMKEQPRSRAVLLHTLGGIFTEWDDLPKAESLLEESLALLDRPDAEPSTELVETLTKLCLLRSKQGRPNESVELAQRALPILEQLEQPENSLLRAKILVAGGDGLGHLHQLEPAEAWFGRAIALLSPQADRSTDHGILLGQAHRGLGWIAFVKTDWQGEVTHNTRSVEVFEKALGKDNLRIAEPLAAMANGLRELRRPIEAEAALRRSLEIQERLRGAETLTFATGLANLGDVLAMQRNFIEAERVYRRSLEIHRRLLPPFHPYIPRYLSGLAKVIFQSKTGRTQEAIDVISEASDVLAKSEHSAFPLNVGLLAWWGDFELDEQPVSAEAKYRRALEILLEHDQPILPILGATQLRLGRSLIAQGRIEEAREACRKSLAYFDQTKNEGLIAKAKQDAEQAGCR